MFGISDAIERAINPGDDVIGTTTRLITADEMRSMANQPSTVERGIQYNFFTWHRGHGGIYRVYFDVVPK
jgi:azurin